MSTLILADMVWPALFMEDRLMSLWVILLGLAVELAVIIYAMKVSWKWAIFLDLVMNGTSAFFGIFLIPYAGLAWEYGPGTLMYRLFGVGTFNPLTWLATFIGIVLINTLIEWPIARFLFKVPKERRPFLWVAVANVLSVAIALVSVFIVPPNV